MNTVTDTRILPPPTTAFAADRWVRSADGMIAGVSGGLAKALGVEPWIVRLLWVVSVLAFGTGVAIYLVLAFCLPREDRLHEAYQKRYLGVCYRISRKTGHEVGLIRVLAVALALASFGATMVAYLVLYVVLKEDEKSLAG
jgi:phage shock protein PspC (stress-responsive transcriptional regulator)